MKKMLSIGLLAILVLSATWSAPEASLAQSDSPIGLVGEQTSQMTWDGRNVDLYVSADRMDDLMVSFAARPEMYDGMVILVEVAPYLGGDTTSPDDDATRSMAAANAAAYPASPAPACATAPAAAPAGTYGIFLNCVGPETRFVARSWSASQGTAGLITLAVNELGRPVPATESRLGFSEGIPAAKPFVWEVVLNRSGEATINFIDSFPMVSTAGAGAVALDALSRTVFQFADVTSIRFEIAGSCEAFWARLGGEGCFRFVAPSEIEEFDSAAFAIAASFPETIYPNEPNGYTDFYPSTANTRRVFLSKACHDGNDGTSGGPCIDNTGCSSYSENTGSGNISNEAVLGTQHGVPGFNNFLERQYTVRIGQGTARNNIARSNMWVASWSSAVHIPVHSNASGSGSCSSTSGGTWGMYNNTSSTYGKPATAGREVADLLWQTTVGVASPGANDKRVLRNDLGELKPPQVEAVAAYLESEFHTWPTGRNFLIDYRNWAWQVTNAVDACFGKPRWTTNPFPHVILTGTRLCTWAPAG